MKVILTQTVEKLGRIGEVLVVKEGYARNYLFPKNLAREATPSNMKALESLKNKQAAEDESKLSEAKEIAEKIGALSITISAKAGEEEKLFGAITSEMIAKSLQAENVSIDKKDIILDEPIKKLGVYQVLVKVHPEVKATLRVWIVKESTSPSNS